MSDGELATARVVGINAHGLSHLKLIEVGTGSLSELTKLSLDLQSLKLFLGRVNSLEEGCLLLRLLILLLELTLRTLAILLRTLSELLAWTLLLLHLLILLSVATLSLDEATLVLVSTLSLLAYPSRPLVEARDLSKKDMSLSFSNFGAFHQYYELSYCKSIKKIEKEPAQK